MKKHLIALAVSGAFVLPVSAQNVTISGVIDLGYRTVDAPAAATGIQTSDATTVAHNGTATTAVIIGMTEDLGGGLRAMGRLELNPDFTAGSALTGSAGGVTGAGVTGLGSGANGYNFVGLEGTMGKVLLGRLNSGTLAAWGAASVFGTAVGSGYGAAGIHTRHTLASGANFNQTSPTRFNNSVEYTTPTFNNFSGRLLYSPGTNRSGNGTQLGLDGTSNGVASSIGSNRADVTEVTAQYSNPMFTVIAAQLTVDVGSNAMSALASPIANGDAGRKMSLTTVGASTKIGAATLRAGYWTEKSKNAASGVTDDAKSYMFGGTYPVGAITLLASMARNDDKTSNNRDRKILGVGADYNLSKRTAAYIRYENRDANTNSDADDATNGQTKTTILGIRHSF